MSITSMMLQQIGPQASHKKGDPHREERIRIATEYVRENGRTRCADIANKLGVVRSTADDIINSLIEKNVIQRDGWGYVKPKEL